eukprot:99771_1
MGCNKEESAQVKQDISLKNGPKKTALIFEDLVKAKKLDDMLKKYLDTHSMYIQMIKQMKDTEIMESRYQIALASAFLNDYKIKANEPNTNLRNEITKKK